MSNPEDDPYGHYTSHGGTLRTKESIEATTCRLAWALSRGFSARSIGVAGRLYRDFVHDSGVAMVYSRGNGLRAILCPNCLEVHHIADDGATSIKTKCPRGNVRAVRVVDRLTRENRASNSPFGQVGWKSDAAFIAALDAEVSGASA